MAHNSKETSDTHYFGVGIYQPKNGWNIGAVMRSAGCFGASFVVASGDRFKSHNADFRNMDTEMARKRIPLFLGVPSLYPFIPHDCEIVVLERNKESVSLPEFSHPRRSFYVFGPEDGEVPDDLFGGREKHSVHIPSSGSLNLGSAAYITMYDRIAKCGDYEVENLTCPVCHSTHVKNSIENEIDGTMIYHCNSCGNEFRR